MPWPMKRSIGSSMLTKWRVWDSVLENYWVEVDAIYKSKIRQRIWRRLGSLSVTFSGIPGLCHPFLHHIQAFGHILGPSQWGTTCDTKNPGKLLSEEWKKLAPSCWLCLYNTPDAQNPSQFIWEEWKFTSGFVTSNSKSSHFQMVPVDSFSNRRKGL